MTYKITLAMTASVYLKCKDCLHARVGFGGLVQCQKGNFTGEPNVALLKWNKNRCEGVSWEPAGFPARWDYGWEEAKP